MPYSPAGALAFGAVAGGTHFLFDPANTEWLCALAGFRSIKKPNGEVDWVTPAWFPVRRVSDDELAKWKLAVVSFGRVEYLEDADIVRTRFRKHDNYGNWDDYLGLEHAQTPRANRKKQSRAGYADKPVKIYG